MKHLIIFIVLLLAGCNGDSTMTEKADLPSISDLPDSAWDKLSKKNIYFGHQSVGNNIVDGISSVVASSDSIKLNIKNINEISTYDVPVFAHSEIGENGDTNSKFKDFSKIFHEGPGDKADLAFLKLCYWDIRRKTDVVEVFNNYQKTIEDLKEQYPDTVFIHVTVPLMSHSDSFISKVKRMIKPDNSDLDNIKRNELNDMLKEKYSGNEPVFDVARIEATLPNGKLATFSHDGKKYYYLPDEYTNDGGHLNDHGRKHVAEQLLISLARFADGDYK
ncbi:MAG: SGNH/GDSL hydrolase family protein [Gammaproteobacteria bacterium]|nr:SGNH/GDSL hydrolase family protein [Gammaproteobacteria bacterium]